MTRRVRQLMAPPVQVLFDRAIFSYILGELRKHPDTEDGGKYMGYVLAPSDSRLRGLDLEVGAPVLAISDFLPSGPKAVRSEVELLPDGEFQEALFRKLERLDPAIEHAGSWHSHHCNGLRTLSSGDVAGYLRTVNKREYRLGFFVASLVKRVPPDLSDQDWIDHFLFVRGKNDYHCINESIRVVDWPTVFGYHTGHSETSGAATPTPAPATGEENLEGRLHIPWYETEVGRGVLAEDKRAFKREFGGNVLATRNGAVITLTGRRKDASIAVIYPVTPEERDLTVVLSDGSRRIFRISCELDQRTLALKAALASIEFL